MQLTRLYTLALMLPVDPLLPALRQTLAASRTAVLQAPPGAGKTTRVPLALLDADWLGGKKIVMLEPRRLAARTAARYMAHTLGEGLGETVGYRIRMDARIGARTRIEVVTEGILTRRLQEDPAIGDVGLVVFDEFHERSLQADLALALCLDVQSSLRQDLRLLVMSATLDGAAVARLLGEAPVLSSTGRNYPVNLRYRPLRAHPVREPRRFCDEVARTVLETLGRETGSLLVFLPGAGEIRQVENALRSAVSGDNVILAPLYGQLSNPTQDLAIQPAPTGKRKVVIATAIAETSLTIEGIRVVIDAGLMRLPRFDPNTGLTRLVTLPVTQAAATQRAGRAGRLQAGVCYRLWPEHLHLLAQATPEILEADLAPLVLELAQWGVREVGELRWLDPPPAAHVAQATDLLQRLGVLDAQARITAHGRSLLQFGAHPRLAHMMLRGRELGCGALACELAALLGERDPLRGAQAREADILPRLELLRGLHTEGGVVPDAVRQIRTQAAHWRRQLRCEAVPADHADLALTGVVLAYAYPDRIAQRRAGAQRRYLLSNGRGAMFTEAEPLVAGDWIVAAHLDGAREARIFLAAAIPRELLLRHHGAIIEERTLVAWDEREQGVQTRRQQRLGALVVSDEPWPEADGEAVQAALIGGIRRTGGGCLPWSDAARELQARIGFLHRLAPRDWPDVSDAALLSALEHWLGPYLQGMTRLAQLRRIDLSTLLLAQLSWPQQRRLDELAPACLTVPSGSRIRIDYRQETPVLAVRLQEMFGLTQTPCVAGGRVPVLLHLLSPARRPMQITRDLAAFWQVGYHEVKKELKGRYPKHHWPDDPLKAQPVAGVKRRH
jgi:ATP-dependent RNA helicase HrpB